jgi:regulator of protease activity HflC (stomatin/prohibitin superfamily)
VAEIRRFPFVRHLRTDAVSHIIQYRGAQVHKSGVGLALWFNPMHDSIAEIPTDYREQTLVVHGRTADFQAATVQGILTFRAADPERLAARIDFSIDLSSGQWRSQPLEKLTLMLSQLAQEYALGYIARTPVRMLLSAGVAPIRDAIEAGLRATSTLEAMGLELETVRIGSVAPSADLEKAIEAPTRERIKQEADEAAYGRRALAVEKERAIAENEMQNQIELAKREEQLIAQRGSNAKRTAIDAADASKVRATSEAERIAIVEGARADLERQRLEFIANVQPKTLMALAAREFAGKIENIEHLNITPDLLGTLLTDVLAGREAS